MNLKNFKLTWQNSRAPLYNPKKNWKKCQEALERQKAQELEDKEECKEAWQKLQQILLTDPKLKEDIIVEDRFCYKAFNHHLSEDEIDSKSSDEMLPCLTEKLKNSIVDSDEENEVLIEETVGMRGILYMQRLIIWLT